VLCRLLFVSNFSKGGVGWCFSIARAIYFFNPNLEKKDAKDKDKSSCSKTIQKDRYRETCLFEIPCQSYFDKEEHKAKAVSAAKSAY